MRWLWVCFFTLCVASAGAQTQLASAGYVGLSIRDLSPEDAKALNMGSDRGALITQVKDGSPGERAGLKRYDVLVRFGGRPINSAHDLVESVGSTPPGRRVVVQFWRNGRLQTADVTTGERPGIDPQDASPIFQMVPADIPEPVLIWRNTVLGTECEPLTPQLATFFGVQRGILVRFVAPGSLADEGGVKAGDVVVSAADHPVTNPRELTAALEMTARSGSRTLNLSIVRAEKKITLHVPLTD